MPAAISPMTAGCPARVDSPPMILAATRIVTSWRSSWLTGSLKGMFEVRDVHRVDPKRTAYTGGKWFETVFH